MSNPYLDRKDGPLKLGKRAEGKAVRRMGLRPRPASGAVHGVKGDAELGDYVMEIKSTETGVIGVRYEDVRKLVGETALGRVPCMGLQFVDSTGQVRPDGGWVAVPEVVWKRLVELE